MQQLVRLPRLLNELRELIQDVVYLEADINVVTPLEAARLVRSRENPPESRWMYAKLHNGSFLFIDEVPSNAREADALSALVIPPVHIGLISWWLMHAWRFVELATDCLDGLGRWNVNTGAILGRALIEEVGCTLYESRAIAESWAKVKALPAKDGTPAIYESLRPLLARFRFGNRGMEHLADVKAPNVLTYVDKLKKLPALGAIRKNYDWLSNVAHPGIGSRFVYLGQPMTHFSGAVTQIRIARRPTSAGGQSHDLDFPVAHAVADTLNSLTPVGNQLLWAALKIVDDFGLTAKAYRLTDRMYWRKLRHRSSEKNCPCGCGEWKRNQHRWGALAPASL